MQINFAKFYALLCLKFRRHLKRKLHPVKLSVLAYQTKFLYHKLLTGNSFSVLVKESTLVSQAKGSVIPTLMVKARFWLMLFIHKMVDFILTMMNTSPRLVHGGMDHRAYFMLLCTRLVTP